MRFAYGRHHAERVGTFLVMNRSPASIEVRTCARAKSCSIGRVDNLVELLRKVMWARDGHALRIRLARTLK